MESFNEYVNVICAFVLISSILLQLLGRRFLAGLASFSGSSLVKNYEFIKFRRRFLIAFLVCIFAFSLQKAYLYYLYQSYGFFEHQIAILYIVALVADAVFHFAVVYLLQRVNRKVICCCFSALSSFSCLMKFSSGYFLLLIGSVADGICSSLLYLSFQEWYRHEHVIDYDFPEEWISSTFGLLNVASAYLLVASGYTAEISAHSFRITAFPFLLSIPLLIGGGTWICFKWPSNYMELTLRRQYSSELRKSLKTITQNSNIILLCVAQTFFQSATFIFEFLWTPLFAHLMPIYRFRPSFGALYSTLTAGSLFGTILARYLSRKCSAACILSLSAGLGLVGAAGAVMAAYPDHETRTKYEVVLAALVLFNVGGGLYASCAERIRGELVPHDTFYFSVPFLRFPAFLVASVLLCVVTTAGLLTTWLLLVSCLFLMLMCLMASFALHGTINRHHQSPDYINHFVLPLKSSGTYEIN